ncbi:MAG TPA: ABC transporter permease [Bryobacteraceae bacterium]
MLWLDSLWLDCRFAVRQFFKAPAFSAIAVVILALGIGMDGAVFTVTNAVLFKGFRLVNRNDRVMYIHDERNGQYSGVSYPDFEDWRNESKAFDGMGAVADLKITLDDRNGFPERYTATQITTNTFRVLGQQPIVGRDFTASDETPGATPVAILSFGFWERRFGKDPAVIGRTLDLSGTQTTVIGVMPQGFSFPQDQDLWIPLLPAANLQKRDARNLWFAFGRLRDGATLEEARAELEVIGNRLAAAYPQTNQGEVPRPHTFSEFYIGPDARMIYGMLWGAVGFVLLIACANLSNLLLARLMARAREISQRFALGASQRRILRQLFVENLLLSAAGGLLGWWIAKITLLSYAQTTNPAPGEWRHDLLDYTMDYRALTYLSAISIATAFLFGLVPALRYSRVDLNVILKSDVRGAVSGRGVNSFHPLLTVQVALTVILLAGAGTLIHSFLNIYTADVGASTGNVRTMLLHLPEAKYPDRAAQASFFGNLQTRLEAIPGVESASTGGVPAGGVPRPSWYELPGAEPVDEKNRPTAVIETISSDYFRTLGPTIYAGREFTRLDRSSGDPVVIVNERFAREHWPGQNPIGQRIRLFDGAAAEAWRTVVGVASNIIYDPNRQQIRPVIYVPYAQTARAADMWILVRSPLPAGELAASFRHEINALDPGAIIWLGPFNLSERLAAVGLYRDIRNNAVLLLSFACIALLIASFGLYAAMSHSVSRRTQEIGVRIALGATPHDIVKLVFKIAISPLVAGLIVGLAGSLAVSRVLSSELVRVSSADPSSLAAASSVLLASAILGCWIPLRRAMRLDPALALKRE